MTYIPTREGWLYLAVLLDLSSRRVVGWATGATLATELPLAALDQALHTRREAHLAIAEYIETWYNVERLHSTLGYMSPMRYEEQLRPRALGRAA